MKRTLATLLITSIVLSTLMVFSPQVKIWAANGLGKALNFDGADDYVQVADSADLKGMTELSLEAWIKPDSFPQYAGIMAKWKWPSAMQYILGYFNNGLLFFWVGTDTTGDSMNVTQPSLGVWTHIVAVFKGGTSLEIFYDGVSKKSEPTPIASIGTGAEPLYIGKYNGYEFDGTIDEVRVYDRALSSTEISAHYNSGVGQYGRPEAGLVGGWHFDDVVGTTTNDYSENGNAGTVFGATLVEGHVPLPDLAILSVVPSSTKVISGDSVNIDVTVKNLGTPFESFDVKVYYNTTVLGTTHETNMAPGSTKVFAFTWNTVGIPLGQYEIKATVSAVQGEVNMANNEKIDGTIWIVDYPTASFTYSPVPAVENDSTTFDASSSTPNGGIIVDYEWDFGDGNVTHTSNPIIMHVYASHGMYAVTLTVTDDEDLDGMTSQDVEVLRHDIAIVEVLPYREWIYEGCSINVNVTVTNEGNFTETATIDLYYNITENKLIGTQFVMLEPGETETLTFMWDTTGIPHARNYTITAVATIAFDSDLTDNAMNGTTKIHVRILGDINGDNKVDLKDFWILGSCFGHCQGQPDWNPDTDLNFDNRVDVKDIFKFGKQYGHVG